MGDVHAPTLMAAIVDGTRGAATQAASSSLVAERKIFRGRHTEYGNTPSRAHGICCKVQQLSPRYPVAAKEMGRGK